MTEHGTTRGLGLKKALVSFTLCMNALLLVILFTPLTDAMYRPLVVKEPAQAPVGMQAIVILSCNYYPEGLPGPRTMNRLHKGLQLYRAGVADRIVCLGGLRKADAAMSVAEAMRDALLLYGVPAGDVIVRDETINTYNDLVNLVENPVPGIDPDRSVYVTSAYHSLRVRLVLDKLGVRGAVVPALPVELTPNKWSERLDLFREAAREYLALCYFRLAGYISFGGSA